MSTFSADDVVKFDQFTGEQLVEFLKRIRTAVLSRDKVKKRIIVNEGRYFRFSERAIDRYKELGGRLEIGNHELPLPLMEEGEVYSNKETGPREDPILIQVLEELGKHANHELDQAYYESSDFRVIDIELSLGQQYYVTPRDSVNPMHGCEEEIVIQWIWGDIVKPIPRY